MSTITLPNIRVSSDLTVKLKLKDGGVALDWSTLQNIKVSIYSDAQRALAGRCSASIDAEDPTLLVCTYAANKPQYVGVNRVVVSAKYMGETKTYDKPAFNFVRWTDDQAGEQITIDDPDIDVEIEVEDVSSSILNQAIAAALQAAEDAEHAAHLIPNQVLLDCEQATTDANAAAAAANAAGITSVQVSVEDNEPGTPSAECSLANKVLSIIFHYLKGATGDAAGFGTISASFVEDGGDPSVLVTTSGPDTAKNIAFTLKNFKGDKGDKGDQGNTGSSVDYPFELVNNETTDDATKAHTAAGAKRLKDELSQLEHKVTDLDNSIGLLPIGKNISNIICETSSTDEITITAGPGYTRGYFNIPLPQGTAINSASFDGPATWFYWVNENGLDTSAQISAASFPLITPYKVTGIACPGTNTTDITFEIVAAVTDKVQKISNKLDNLETNTGLALSQISEDVEGIKEKIGELPTGKSVSDIICVPQYANKQVTGGPLYTKGFFDTPLPQGTAINSASFDGPATWFYWVNENGLDTSAQISAASFPLITPYKVTGIACPGQNTTTLTFRIKDGVADKVNIIEGRIDALETKKGWEGRTIVCFGDSITMMEYQGKHWTDHLADLTGATVINVGIGGSTYRQRAVPVENPSTESEARAALDVVNMIKAAIEQNFTKQVNGVAYIDPDSETNYYESVTNLQSIDWQNVDSIVLFAGTNDWFNAGQMIGDDDTEDFAYTKGALNYILSSFGETYPNVHINIFLPIVRYVDPPQFSQYENYVVGDIVMYNNARYQFTAPHSGEWDAADVVSITSYQARIDSLWSDNYRNPAKGNLTLREYGENIAAFVKSKYHLLAKDMYDIGWNRKNFDNFFIDVDATHPYKGLKDLAYFASKQIQ